MNVKIYPWIKDQGSKNYGFAPMMSKCHKAHVKPSFCYSRALNLWCFREGAKMNAWCIWMNANGSQVQDLMKSDRGQTVRYDMRLQSRFWNKMQLFLLVDPFRVSFLTRPWCSCIVLHCWGLTLTSQGFPFSLFLPIMTPPLGTRHRILTPVGRRDMKFSFRLLLGFISWYLRFRVDLLPLWMILPLFVEGFHPLILGCACTCPESFLSRLLKLPHLLFIPTRFSLIIWNKTRCLTSTLSMSGVNPPRAFQFLCCFFVKHNTTTWA